MLKFSLPIVLGLLVVLQVVTPSQQTYKGGPKAEAAKPVSSRTLTSSDIFLKLAESVGQGVPAKRLIEFKQKNDGASEPRYWAVVDFNRPSTEKRLFVFDIQAKRVEAFYVAHGKGSEGAVDDGMAEAFSNEDGSNSSSLGIYRAMEEYVGGHGRSMRLEGLESTNSNARSRAVVLHRADYVSEDFIRQTGRLGRSDGCLAVENSVADALIDKLEKGALIIAWKK